MSHSCSSTCLTVRSHSVLARVSLLRKACGGILILISLVTTQGLWALPTFFLWREEDAGLSYLDNQSLLHFAVVLGIVNTSQKVVKWMCVYHVLKYPMAYRFESPVIVQSCCIGSHSGKWVCHIATPLLLAGCCCPTLCWHMTCWGRLAWVLSWYWYPWGWYLFIKEGKVMVGLGKGSKCSVIAFLRMRRMSSWLFYRVDPARDAEWEL